MNQQWIVNEEDKQRAQSVLNTAMVRGGEQSAIASCYENIGYEDMIPKKVNYLHHNRFRLSRTYDRIARSSSLFCTDALRDILHKFPLKINPKWAGNTLDGTQK